MINSDVKSGVAVLGATSLVGACLLQQLIDAGHSVTAFTRQPLTSLRDDIRWRQFILSDDHLALSSDDALSSWICVAPIWVLPNYFDLLEKSGARRVVALSSTSRFTKDDSSDIAEQAVARQLADAEVLLQTWAENQGIEWVVLRPTLIYGMGRDKNITEIARFINRFGFFPVCGEAAGLRQPIHAADVASACLSALSSVNVANHAYNISGGETLTYREMVRRVFIALGRRPHFLMIPLWCFRFAVVIFGCFPRYRKWTAAMAERMNRDLVFEHTAAEGDVNFKPRLFTLDREDLPS